MKHLLHTTIAAVVLVGCVESQQSVPQTETKPESSTAKAPDISIHAAEGGNIEAVKQQIAAGTDVNAKDEWGVTPLHNAATKEIVELLIAAGADVNAKDDEAGETPLHNAATKEIVELLIAAGADVHAKGDEAGETPLHNAAYEGHKEIAELLIAAGANVSAISDGGITPLYIATEPGNPNASTELANLLRKHGAKTGEELKAEGK